jgi:Mce-associated membrane protein
VTDALPEAPQRLLLSRGVRATAIALVVLSVLLAGASAVLGWTVLSHKRDSNALRDAREAALTAARQEIVNLDSLDHATIDRDLKRVVDGATGDFKDQFTRAQGDLKALTVERKSVATGKVLWAGIVRADTDTATILIAADRTVRDATDTEGGIAHDRWRVDLEKHGGRWLVSDLESVA